ncbi:MAG: response regulator transcription factor [Clostridiales Family XIII bacterium]|jgi:DNA-binding response OmpR family regulator|nr:response regulator transcription factor [Clostridiales Family XIII bacterium]
MADESLTILVVDDEPAILEGVAAYLAKQGYRVLQADSGRGALSLFEKERVDLVLLDLMLPDIPGEEVCRRIRARSRVPVIMLTAKVAEEDIVGGLALGADGYVTKPFGLKELRARMEALLRRASDGAVPLAAAYTFGGSDLTADFASGVFTKRGVDVRLTRAEQRILALLVHHPGRIFTRDEIIDAALGGEDFTGFDRSVDAHIKNLRRKIETDPRHPAYVLTAHGFGYKFGGGGSGGGDGK